MPKNKSPLRINIVTEYFYPANNAPGARFKPLVDALLESSTEVIIYTSKISAQVKEYKINYNLITFPSNQRSTLIRLIQELLFGVETFIRLTFSKGDIYYITSPSYINCILAFLYCQLFNKKYVLDIRDDYPRVYFDSGLISEKRIFGRILSWIEKKLYQQPYILIAATNGLKTNIEIHYPKKIYLLRNGYSEKLFIPSSKKYDKFTLVFHGIISKYQDIDLLIQLGQIIDDRNLPFNIIVIGQGNQDYKLKGEIPKSIKYLGPLSYSEIPSTISMAHMGLSFRKPGKISEDSFPVKIYEYIGVLIPIISTPISEAGAYISDNKIGYQFDPSQKEELLNKILEISLDRELYNTLTVNLEKIRAEFSREKNSLEFVHYMLSLIQNDTTSIT